MRGFIEKAEKIYSGTRELRKAGICLLCLWEIIGEDFRNKNCWDEYYISGLCQDCQDKYTWAD